MAAKKVSSYLLKGDLDLQSKETEAEMKAVYAFDNVHLIC